MSKNVELCKTELVFKQNLITLREQRKCTPYRVAKDCGLTFQYYYRLENMTERTSPSWQTLEKIASFYEIEPYMLLIKQ